MSRNANIVIVAETKLLEADICLSMAQIPEVEDVWVFVEHDTRTYVMILGTHLYNREVHMKVYKCEYDLFKSYPDIDICFHCVPVRFFVGNEFLPDDAVRIFQK